MYVRSNCCHFAGTTFFFGETLFTALEVTCVTITLVSALAVMLAKVRKIPAQGPAHWWLPMFFLAMLAVGVYAAEQPQRGFLHYLLFLVFPLSGLAGSMAGLALLLWRSSKLVGTRSVTVALGSLIAVAALAPPVLIRLAEGNVFQKYFYGETGTSMIPPEVSQAVRRSASTRRSYGSLGMDAAVLRDHACDHGHPRLNRSVSNRERPSANILPRSLPKRHGAKDAGILPRCGRSDIVRVHRSIDSGPRVIPRPKSTHSRFLSPRNGS